MPTSASPTTGRDRDQAVRVAEDLARRPVPPAQRRRIERRAAGAAEAARQLQQRATSRRRGR
jgi:hypothetical protein